MHAEISLSYSGEQRIRKLDAAQYQRLVEGFPDLDLPVPQPADEEAWKASKWSYWSVGNKIIELDTLGKLLVDLDLSFEIHKFKNTYHVRDHSHTHIHVAIPNVGLLMIDEVTYVEDSCTDALQRSLDDGWRILAVCPPNAQRRPDYILGRTKKDTHS